MTSYWRWLQLAVACALAAMVLSAWTLSRRAPPTGPQPPPRSPPTLFFPTKSTPR